MLKPESKESKRKAGRRNTPVVVKVQAVERMKLGANVTELARELGVDRSLRTPDLADLNLTPV